MLGVIQKKDIIQHPFIIIEGFGVRVLIRALIADEKETFLDIVNECFELEEHEGMDDLSLSQAVKQFLGFELRVREIYLSLEKQMLEQGYQDVSQFFQEIAAHEEGHAVVLARVRKEISRGHFWKDSADVYQGDITAFEKALKAVEEQVAKGPTLAEALDIVDALEGSEINMVFDNLKDSVDMKSRTYFERFFVMTNKHLQICSTKVQLFRERYINKKGNC